MQANQDLNSNLIKSLTSVHLPPPPSSHAEHSDQHTLQTTAPSKLPHQGCFVQKPQDTQQSKPTVHIGPQKTQGSQLPAQQQPYRRHSEQGTFSTSTKKRVSESHSSTDLRDKPTAPSLQTFHTPVQQEQTTPVHSTIPNSSPPVVIEPVSEPDTQVQFFNPQAFDIPLTPTLTQGRLKKASAKNPLSPQYSSPSQNLQADSSLDSIASCSSSRDITKPPQPTFTAPKTSKKLLRDQQREQKRLKKLEEETFVLPQPHKMPPVIHEGDTKPPYSYATLIGMAILRGDQRKLTLSQIYHWISSTFKYYSRNDVGWQNSIRHNLSLNKAFVKAEKAPDGKGHYWEVASGCEMQFVKGKSGKRSSGVAFDHSKSDRSDETASVTAESRPSTSESVQQKVALDAGDMTSEDEFSDDDADDSTKTPKSQIRSIEGESRPSLRKSHTAIGLQRYSLPKIQLQSHSDEEFDEEIGKVPRKKQQLKSISTGSGSLSKIPSLEAPETNWAASALGERIIFGQIKPDSESPKSHMPSFPLTSSFSCNTNFDVSPLKRQETGPLLEPLTPSSRLPSFTTATTVSNLSLPSTQPSLQATHQNASVFPHVSKTPLRTTSGSHQNVVNGLMGSSSTQHFYNFLKTPTTKSRTPNTNTNSIMRKFLNSPGFLDDFYTSPSITRYPEGHAQKPPVHGK
ncbi:Forkhead transcription factor HCM1 [Cyberlindnera fabianii]|uniref:Forkhead transcription factor HCM1 n=1 Tax=Cyberlindnera fabianii TaxID=36022 RepID=A0A1V2LB76_CYBFA|nr:Forkhead transcription factor HCM1 [Cyberlindnera fabianii]